MREREALVRWWHRSDVATGARRVDLASAAPWGGLRYALGVGALLLVVTPLLGARSALLVGGGAVNAGAVGVGTGLRRPRSVMVASTGVLASSSFLGLVSAGRPVVDVAVLAALALLAGLAARAGAAASVVGVQSLVGFVTLGRTPTPLAGALTATGLVAAGGLAQVLLGAVLRAPGARRAGDRPATARDALVDVARAVRHPDGAARWHALRLALCLVLAQSAALVLFADRGYWITLAALTVLKPDWSSTFSRGIDRWVGTTAGAVAVGALASGLDLHGIALDAVVTLLVWGALTLEPVNYALYTAALAGYVVFYEQVAAAAPAQSALLRAGNTTAGAALAVLVRALVRPRSLRRAVPAGLARALAVRRGRGAAPGARRG